MPLEQQRQRINLSVDQPLFDELQDWADQQMRPVASLSLWLLARAMEQAKKSGEYQPSKSSQPVARQSQLNVLDVQRLADSLGIPSDKLLKAAKQIKLEVINGAKSS